MTEEIDTQVTPLGEDGEAWLVHDVSDQVAARHLVIEYERYTADRTEEEITELAADLLKGEAEYRTDWWWSPAQHVGDYILRKGEEEPVPTPFAGTWVSL